MVLGREATGIQRDCPLVDRGHVPEHQPLGDFSRHETEYRVQDCRFGRAGPERGIIAGHVAKEVVNLLVAAQTMCETGPARPLFRRPEDGAEQWPHALRPDQHPRLAGSDVPSIDGVVRFLQVVGADDDGEGRVPRAHRHPHRVEPPGELAGRLRRPPRSMPKVVPRPVGARRRARTSTPPVPIHREVARNDVSPGGQGHDRGPDVECRVRGSQGGNDVPVRAAAIQKRQEIGMNRSAEQRVEGFGNQEHLPVVDGAILEVRREQRPLDEAAVGGGRSLQQPGPGVLGRRCRPAPAFP